MDKEKSSPKFPIQMDLKMETLNSEKVKSKINLILKI